MLIYRGSKEAAEFINRNLEEWWKKKKEGKEIRGIVNEIEGMEGQQRNKDLAGRSRRI
jgi:ribosomal protein L35AE/L33A